MFWEQPRKQLASGGAEISCFRTPPPKLLIFKGFAFRPFSDSLGAQTGGFAGAPLRGSPTLRAAPPPPNRPALRADVLGWGRLAPTGPLPPSCLPESKNKNLVVGQGRSPRRCRWVCGRRLGSRWAIPVVRRWAGAACPRAVHQVCPRAEPKASQPVAVRPSSTYPRARVSRGRSPLGKGEARAVQGRRPPQPAQRVTTSRREV